MASAGIGSLVVRLGLDAAEFTTGLTKSEQQAKKFAESIDRGVASAINAAAVAVTALVASAGLAAVAFQKLVAGAGEFQDLADKTGAAAVDIASLAVAAATAGVSVEDVAGSLNKLTKNLVGVDDESKAAGAALKALGVNVADFKKLDPVGQYEAVGKALANFADGAGKVAVAQALLGKSGPEQLRVFKALEDAGGRQAILTAQQISQADEYADRQAKSRAQLLLYAQAAASDAVPALTALTKTAVDFAKELLGVDAATGKLVGNNGVAKFAESAGEGLAELIDKFAKLGAAIRVAVAISDVGGPRALFTGGIFSADARKRVTDALDDYQKIKDRIDNGEGAAGKFKKNLADGTAAAQAESPTKSALKFNFDAGSAAKAAAEQKKVLDGQLKAIHDFAQQQKGMFDFADQLAKGSYEDGLTSLRAFYVAQDGIRAEALQSQLASIDKEIAALRAYKPKDGADRVDNENKIAEAVAKRSDAVTKGARANILSAIEEARALKVLLQSYDDLRANILQLSGDAQGASQLRIAKQLKDARDLNTALQDQPVTPIDLSAYAQVLTNTEAISEAQRQYSRLLESTRNQEELMLLAAQTSGKGELETLAAVGAARRGSLAQLGEMADRARELALASGGNPEAIAFAERLGLAYQQAAAQIDPLAKKFNGLFSDSFADAFTDFATGAKSASDAFNSFAKSVVSSLIHIAAQQTAMAIFGGGSAAGGAAGSGGFGSVIGEFFSGLFGGGKAIGGMTRPNTLYRVNERGPELYQDGSRQFLMTGDRQGRIAPNSSLGGGSRILNAPITINVPGNTDSRTASQIGSEVSRQLAVANSRFN